MRERKRYLVEFSDGVATHVVAGSLDDAFRIGEGMARLESAAKRFRGTGQIRALSACLVESQPTLREVLAAAGPRLPELMSPRSPVLHEVRA